MFVYHRVVRIQDTDATGVVYFANELQMGLEVFEEFLLIKGFSLGSMVRQGKFFLPIVHTKADFKAPLFVGDKVELTLNFPHIGTTSFTHASTLRKEGKEVGEVLIVHAVYCPKAQQAIPIPDELRSCLTDQP